MRGLLIFLFIICGIQVSATEYYVTSNGSNGNNGLSESSSFKSLTFAASKARSGDIVWIKAGNYGNENVVFKYNGKEGALISFIGYKNTPGDIKTNYFTYQSGRTLNPKEMPLFDGSNRAEGIGLKLYGRSYIQIKNIQITNYRYGIDALSGANNLIIDNVVVSNAGGTSNYGPVSGGNCIRMDSNTNHHNTIVNSVVLNATMIAITVGGDYNKIENNKTYADQDDINGDKRSMDYHVLVSGSNNIIRNHYAEHVGDLAHTGHGLVLKSLENSTPVENNLIENCDVININGSIEFRHRLVKNNIARDIRIKRTTSRYAGGFHFRDGASFNTVENSYVKDISGYNGAISFYDTKEDGGTQWSGNDNIVKNTIFENCDLGIRLGTNNTPSNAYNNKILNCTFYNVDNILGFWPKSVNKNNIIQNCIISKSKLRYYKNQIQSGWSELNNNYFEVGYSIPSGNGNISVNPDFVDASQGNFRLKSSSKLINAGKKIGEVEKDFDGNARPQGNSHDIGAFEYQDGKTSSIKANAGEDQTICFGEEITLTASGGSAYLWSTGATTKSIKVSPEETVIYSVKVSEGNASDSDDVQVNVNKVAASAGADIIIAPGDTVALNASGGTAYLWNNGETGSSISVSPNSTTTYTVRVSNDGCEAFDEVIVQVYDKNLSTVSAYAGEDQTICLGEELNLTATGGTSYLWSTGETTKSIKVSPLATQNYTVTVSDGNTTDIDTVTISTENCDNSVSDIFDTPNIEVFPNPTTGILNLQSNDSHPEVDVHLINVNGKILYQERLKIETNGFSRQLDLSNFTKGIYFVRFIKSEVIDVKKIVLI